MPDESESLEAIVRRIVAEELRNGGIGRLTDIQRAVTQHIQGVGIPSGEAFGTYTVTGGAMGATLQPMQASLQGLLVPPSFVFHAEVIEAVASVSPEVGRELSIRNPQDATVMINFLTAWIGLITALFMAYQILRGEPPTSTQIEQIFNQTINVMIGGPPQQPPGLGSGAGKF